MRTVTMHITQDQLTQINAKCCADLTKRMVECDSRTQAAALRHAVNAGPVNHAVGKLCLWSLPNAEPVEGIGQYDKVRITCQNQSTPELVAVYSSSTHPDAKYVIGATWHNGEWDFHS